MSQNDLEPKWEEAVEKLQQYAEREGHARVAAAHVEGDGFKLGGWVQNQRQGYANGKMDPERARTLEALPGWSWSPQVEAWGEAVARLEEYVAREGNARVAVGHVEGDGFRLGAWVLNQREGYKTGKIDPEKQRRLEALPGWMWDPRD